MTASLERVVERLAGEARAGEGVEAWAERVGGLRAPSMRAARPAASCATRRGSRSSRARPASTP